MRATDYGKIAPIYDENEARHDNPPDARLAAQLARIAGPFRVLDVACGTGNYLAAQRRTHPDARISWHGVDASDAMLERAKRKLEGVELLQGRAERLPFEARAFQYLSCNFAFHHFEDKARALDEMSRVLADDGALRIANIAPEHMRQWWVFQVFSQSWSEDQKRFWPVELLVHELERRGLIVSAEIRIVCERMTAAKACRQAAPRDQSSIAIVDEADYEAGLARLRQMSERDESFRSTTAIVVCTALRQ